MARIKIEDLPQGKKISRDIMKTIFGGPARRTEAFVGSFTINTGLQESLMINDPLMVDPDNLLK